MCGFGGVFLGYIVFYHLPRVRSHWYSSVVLLGVYRMVLDV